VGFFLFGLFFCCEGLGKDVAGGSFFGLLGFFFFRSVPAVWFFLLSEFFDFWLFCCRGRVGVMLVLGFLLWGEGGGGGGFFFFFVYSLFF